MELFCAVDIRNGRCVRLRQGDYRNETVYDDNPVRVAIEMAAAGADWIHVVDLDGARSGKPDNAAIVADIATAVTVPVQAGGGVRDAATAEAWFAAGVQRLVLGTAALRDPELVRTLASTHRIAVGLDARSGEIATDGWLRSSGHSLLEVARRFADVGVAALVVTDITRDGMLRGPDLAGLVQVLDATAKPRETIADKVGGSGDGGSDKVGGTDDGGSAVVGGSDDGGSAVVGGSDGGGSKVVGGIDVIASGGVSSLSDLRALTELRGQHHSQRGLSGVIVGKALYEKRFTVTQAAAVLQTTKTLAGLAPDKAYTPDMTYTPDTTEMLSQSRENTYS